MPTIQYMLCNSIHSNTQTQYKVQVVQFNVTALGWSCTWSYKSANCGWPKYSPICIPVPSSCRILLVRYKIMSCNFYYKKKHTNILNIVYVVKKLSIHNEVKAYSTYKAFFKTCLNQGRSQNFISCFNIISLENLPKFSMFSYIFPSHKINKFGESAWYCLFIRYFMLEYGFPGNNIPHVLAL